MQRLGLGGDIRGGLDFAKRALELSDISGQFRTRLGAAINASHFLTWLGNLSEAQQTLKIAFEHPQGNVHLSWGALDARANLQVESGNYMNASQTLEDLRCITETSETSSHPFHWNALSVRIRARVWRWPLETGRRPRRY